MKKFESKFEAQKIPEFYNLYFNYKRIKAVLALAKDKIVRKSKYLYCRRRGQVAARVLHPEQI
jgi:hypothetical protein